MEKTQESSHPTDEPRLVNVNLNLLNHLVHDKAAVHNLLSTRSGYILPSLNSKAITCEYLKGILIGKFWALHYKQFCPYRGKSLRKPRTRAELIDVLAELVPNGQELGINKINPPDKKWLIDVIHSLKQDHPIFEGPPPHLVSIQSIIGQEFGIPADFPPELLKKPKRGFFKKSTDDKKKEAILRTRSKIERLQALEKMLMDQYEQPKIESETLTDQPELSSDNKITPVPEQVEILANTQSTLPVEPIQWPQINNALLTQLFQDSNLIGTQDAEKVEQDNRNELSKLEDSKIEQLIKLHPI